MSLRHIPPLRIPALIAAAGMLAGAPLTATAQTTAPSMIDIEAGVAWQDRNDVQVPNDGTGTRFALDRITGTGPSFAPRLQLSKGVAPRHEVRVVIAPFGLKGSGNFDQPVRFDGRNFAAGGVDAKYRFDSYRATWRYTFHESPDWTWKAGVTGKIRDASITLTQGGTSTTKSNTGFVPLFHLYGERRLSQDSRLTFEGDGLASSRGRAFDLSARYVYDFNKQLSGFAGVRMLDGGANSSTVYNFARFNYVTFGLQYRM